jgi:hypothetical protein
MDYHAIYNNIVTNAQIRGIGDERHHIIPKSCGGSNHVENLVLLTYREHYICHCLLVRMFAPKTLERKKMIYALWWMSKTRAGYTKVSSHQYAYARSMFVENMPTRQDNHRERFRKKHAAGEYNYDYAKVSVSLKQHLSGLTTEEKLQRMQNSAMKCDPVARGNAISKGKASQFEISTTSGAIYAWTYEDVKGITGYTKSQLRYRIQQCNGLLPDGNTVKYSIRYTGNDSRKQQRT